MPRAAAARAPPAEPRAGRRRLFSEPAEAGAAPTSSKYFNVEAPSEASPVKASRKKASPSEASPAKASPSRKKAPSKASPVTPSKRKKPTAEAPPSEASPAKRKKPTAEAPPSEASPPPPAAAPPPRASPAKARKKASPATPSLKRAVKGEAPSETTPVKASPRKAATPDSAKRRRTAVVVEPPADWSRTWAMMVELRADRTAVVDSMGSEKLYDSNADEETRHYQVLISLMLSSQTRDTVTAATMGKLKAHGLSVAHILDDTTDDVLHELIRAVGFHNAKTVYIRNATLKLRSDFSGKVPDTLEGLLSLPGVGPKMALIVLRVAFGVTAGIAVDTHVHRISNQLLFAGPVETKTPEKTREAIESWIPKQLWDETNLLLVGLGQEIQTERLKLLGKALASSDVPFALNLLAVLGMNVDRVAKQNKVELPPDWPLP